MNTRWDLREMCPMDFKAQARVDSDPALLKEWADNDERKEPLPTSDTGKQARAPSPARSPDQGGPGRDSSRMVDATGCEQGSEHPLCLKCEPAVLGSAKHRLWACPAYRETRFDLLPTHQRHGETATGDKI